MSAWMKDSGSKKWASVGIKIVQWTINTSFTKAVKKVHVVTTLLLMITLYLYFTVHLVFSCHLQPHYYSQEPYELVFGQKATGGISMLPIAPELLAKITTEDELVKVVDTLEEGVKKGKGKKQPAAKEPEEKPANKRGKGKDTLKDKPPVKDTPDAVSPLPHPPISNSNM